MSTTAEVEVAEPRQENANGVLQPPPKNKSQLIARIIEAEMAPDGKVDNQRVLTLARLQGPQLEPTMRDVQQLASRIRKERGLHDKAHAERMKTYPHSRKPAGNHRIENMKKAREAKAAKRYDPERMSKMAKAMWTKKRAEQQSRPSTPASFNQLQLLSARSFLAACGNDAVTAAACLETVKSLTL